MCRGTALAACIAAVAHAAGGAQSQADAVVKLVRQKRYVPAVSRARTLVALHRGTAVRMPALAEMLRREPLSDALNTIDLFPDEGAGLVAMRMLEHGAVDGQMAGIVPTELLRLLVCIKYPFHRVGEAAWQSQRKAYIARFGQADVELLERCATGEMGTRTRAQIQAVLTRAKAKAQAPAVLVMMAFCWPHTRLANCAMLMVAERASHSREWRLVRQVCEARMNQRAGLPATARALYAQALNARREHGAAVDQYALAFQAASDQARNPRWLEVAARIAHQQLQDADLALDLLAWLAEARPDYELRDAGLKTLADQGLDRVRQRRSLARRLHHAILTRYYPGLEAVPDLRTLVSDPALDRLLDMLEQADDPAVARIVLHQMNRACAAIPRLAAALDVLVYLRSSDAVMRQASLDLLGKSYRRSLRPWQRDLLDRAEAGLARLDHGPLPARLESDLASTLPLGLYLILRHPEGSPASDVGHVWLGGVYGEMGLDELAVKHTVGREAYYCFSGRRLERWRDKGRLLEAQGKYDDALAQYASLMDRFPGRHQIGFAYERTAVIHQVVFGTAWRSDAVRRRLMRMAPSYEFADLGLRKRQARERIEAEGMSRSLRQELAASPNQTGAYTKLVSAASRLPLGEAREDLYADVIRTSPGTEAERVATLLLAQRRAAAGRVAEAEALALGAVSRSKAPKTRDLHEFVLADIALARGRHLDALKHYKAIADRAIKADPLRKDMAWQLRLHRDYAAYSADEVHAETHYYRGHALLALGQDRAAASAFEASLSTAQMLDAKRAPALKQRIRDAHLALSQIRERAGDLDAAVEHMARVCADMGAQRPKDANLLALRRQIIILSQMSRDASAYVSSLLERAVANEAIVVGDSAPGLQEEPAKLPNSPRPFAKASLAEAYAFYAMPRLLIRRGDEDVLGRLHAVMRLEAGRPALPEAYRAVQWYLFATRGSVAASKIVDGRLKPMLEAKCPGWVADLDRPDALRRLMLTLARLGAKKRSRVVADRLLAAEPVERLSTNVLEQLSRFLFFEVKAYPQAARVFAEFERKTPAIEVKARARFLLAESYYYEGDFAQAKIEWLKFLDKGYPTVYRFREETLHLIPNCDYKLGSYKKAIEGYEAFLKEYPKDRRAVQTLVEMADCHKALKQLPKAAECYRRAIEDYPDQSAWPGGPDMVRSTHYLLAMLYYHELQDYAAAAKTFRSYLKAYPDSPQAMSARLKIASALEALGEYDKAKKELLDVVEISSRKNTRHGVRAMREIGRLDRIIEETRHR